MSDRNLNPHKPAYVAMILYNNRYAKQGGGVMDFWEKLSDGERRNCREIAQRIEECREEKPDEQR